MKQMTLIEMDGFLKGKCIPSDLKVNETNAEYLVRKFAEAEAKCAALAAEHGIQIAINELLALAPRLDKRAVDALSVAVEHLCKLIKKEAVSEQN